jgi:hypothetical protein
MRRVVLGIAAVALAFWAFGARAADEKSADREHAHHLSGPHAACARACADCMLQCDSCHHHCERLVAQGKKEHVKTMRLCDDCGAICAVAARVTSRDGPLSVTICDSCAKACDTCGATCKKFPDDEHMKTCAKACDACAKACREMIKHAGHRTEAQ